jgi:hypothetical protein
VLLDILCAQRHKRMPYGSRSWPVASRNDHISRYKYASVCCAAVQLQFDTFMFQAFLACYWLLANGTCVPTKPIYLQNKNREHVMDRIF